MSRSSRVRRRTHASLVRIKSALDAIHQARTRDTATNRFEVKCIAHYGHNNRRNHVVIYNQNNIHEEHIEKPHERDKHACHLYDSFAATEQAKAHKHSENHTDNPRRHRRIVETVSLERRLQIVRTKQIKSECVCQNQEHSKDNTKPTAMQCSLDIVCRAAIAFACMTVTTLKNLRKRTLDKRRRRTDNRKHPHPKRGTRPAQANRSRNSNDVSRPHSRCSRDEQSIQRRDSARFLRFFNKRTNGLRKKSNLNKPRADTEIKSCRRKNNNQYGVIKDAVNRV